MKMTLGGVPGPGDAAPSTTLPNLHYFYIYLSYHSPQFTTQTIHLHIIVSFPWLIERWLLSVPTGLQCEVGILRETCSI